MGDASNSKAVLAGTTARSVGCDDTLTVAQASVVLRRTDKIQENLKPGQLRFANEAEPLLRDSIVKGLLGEQGLTLAHNDNYVRVLGPPSAD